MVVVTVLFLECYTGLLVVVDVALIWLTFYKHFLSRV